MNIGFLLPLSNAHPGISKEFLDGFNLLIAQKNLSRSINIKKESIGFGGTEREVYAKAEKLLVSDDVDILIGYIDEKVTGMLYALVQSTGKVLIIVNPGANHPLNWVAQPTVIHLTLQHAFLCWLTGAMAARSAAKEAAYASSFYDCGYLHSADMVKNFMVSGGIILHNYINNQPYDNNFHIEQLTDFLTFNAACNNILCVFDELPASLFYDRLNKHTSERPLNLYVSPMMLTKKALENSKENINFSIEGFTSWQPEIDNDENKNFMKSCGRSASIFSLLGWETGLVIDQILQQFKNGFDDGESIIEYLKKNKFSGPRGEMQLDAETLYYTASAIKNKLEAGATNLAGETITSLESDWKTYTQITTEGAVTGWTNTYLCY